MKVLTFAHFGGPEVMRSEERDTPKPAPGEVRIRIAAAGVNRADVFQREGHYPPPHGAPDWPGLEVSGVVDALGSEGSRWKLGDEVCALLPGGGYAEYCVAPETLVLPRPEGVSLVDAAALVEAACTVWASLRVAHAQAGETILIHGGSGGVGSLAVQIAKATGLRVLATARGRARAERCGALGADVPIDYVTTDYADVALQEGGVDIILDILGAVYLERNLRSLATGGRLVLLSHQGGAHAELDLGVVLAKRATIVGTTLRARPVAEKAEIIADLREHVWPWIPGRVRPIVGATFPLEEAGAAHVALESGEVFGKIVLVSGSSA